MKPSPKRYTVTAALPYANGPKHLGHLAGAYLPADAYVRYLRSQKKDVVFVSGSDEHGTAIANQALKEKVSPQEIIDKYHQINKESFEKLDIAFDIYHRTSAPIHHETAAAFFTELYNKGFLKGTETEQYFDVASGKFLADRYITGTCPKCHYHAAYGDQCERCGSDLTPTELIEPRSVLSGSKPELRKTTNWFLPMDELQPRIESYIEAHRDWKPTVYGQCRSWLNEGLKPRAMTRDLDWGVKVPLPGADGKVMYVWFDAPIGYISATRQWALDHQKNWEPYWKDKDTKLVHFLGKDNIVFHCITFPLMLMLHGDYILPDNVPANEFMNLEGEKMSTSRGWSIEMHEYLNDFPGKVDVLRYYLLSILPEQKDSEFTWKDYQARNNNELVAILGNFVNRALVLTHKFCGGKVPAPTHNTEADLALIAEMAAFPGRVGAHLEQFRFRDALMEMMNLARLGNKYLADTEPWKIIQTQPERAAHILHLSLQLCASLSALCLPFLPNTAAAIADMLNIGIPDWEQAGKIDLLKSGHVIKEARLLFSRVEDEVVENQLKKLREKAAGLSSANAAAEINIQAAKETITYEAFSAMDLRVAQIIEAEKVAGTDKLLKLLIDTGLDKRIIVSGIALHYTPDQLPGKKVLVLVNLEPRKIRGIESKGMILMAEDGNGKLSLVCPVEDVHAGSVVK